MPDKKATLERRAAWLAGIITLAFVGILARLWWLQLFLGEALLEASEQNRTRLVRIHAPRGAIVDRRGRPLADTRETLSLAVVPDFEEQNPDLLAKLAPLVNLSHSELRALVEEAKKNHYDPIVLIEDLPPDMLARVVENQVYLNGVVVLPGFKRYYPGDGKLATHLLGELREVSPENLERLKRWGYRMGDMAGRSGIEKEYNRFLRGTDGGQVVEVNALGQMQRVLQEIQPHAGAKLTLAIDARVQEAAVKGLRGRPGAAVAVDPRNGDVLAIASAPTYDSNIFARKVNKKVIQSVLLDPRYPLINRAISSPQPPGSTFKLISATAALHYKAVTPSFRVHCAGGLSIPGRFKRCWSRHGTVDFYGAIAQSCDSWFYRVGLKLGPWRIGSMAKQFGLGAHTGIDLPNERKGWIPDPEWFKRRTGEDWRPDHTCNTVIGQGDVLATPLQMALMAAAVGNGGKLYKPRVLLKAHSWDGKLLHKTEPKLVRRVKVAPEVLAEVQRAAQITAERGTGRIARFDAFPVGAKTGSAQFQRGKKTHGWFIAYAPANNPKIAVAVILEAIGHGGENSGPIARDMIAAWLGQPLKYVNQSTNSDTRALTRGSD